MANAKNKGKTRQPTGYVTNVKLSDFTWICVRNQAVRTITNHVNPE